MGKERRRSVRKLAILSKVIVTEYGERPIKTPMNSSLVASLHRFEVLLAPPK